MAKSGRVATAELVSRGKEQLVLIWSYKKGLVLHTHTMYYSDEVRDFAQEETRHGRGDKEEKDRVVKILP
jgi:non-homologous end joining protein Ku